MNNMRIAVLAVFTAASLGCSSLSALEIPLGGAAAAGGGSGGASVGFVDMDRIFQIYPQTQAAKEDYAKQLQKRRDQLAEKEAQVNNLKSRISILESTVKDIGTAAPPDDAVTSDGTTPSPSPGNAGASNLQDMKTQLETQILEYEDLRKQAEKDLAVFQSRQSEIILGKIYESLRDLAQEEQLTVIVDKASILYGDTAIDLTDKLQAKVRGY